MLGFYHSHPHRRPCRRRAIAPKAWYPGYLYLIVSVRSRARRGPALSAGRGRVRRKWRCKVNPDRSLATRSRIARANVDDHGRRRDLLVALLQAQRDTMVAGAEDVLDGEAAPERALARLVRIAVRRTFPSWCRRPNPTRWSGSRTPRDRRPRRRVRPSATRAPATWLIGGRAVSVSFGRFSLSPESLSLAACPAAGGHHATRASGTRRPPRAIAADFSSPSSRMLG